MHLKTKLWTQKLKRLLENNLEPGRNKKITQTPVFKEAPDSHILLDLLDMNSLGVQNWIKDTSSVLQRQKKKR